MKFLKEDKNTDYEKLFRDLLKGCRRVTVDNNVAYFNRPIDKEYFKKYIVDELPEFKIEGFESIEDHSAIDSFMFTEM